MKIFNIGERNLHITQTTWGISMKPSEKMRLTIVLKFTKMKIHSCKNHEGS